MASEQPLLENAIKDYLESCSTIKLSQNIRLGIPEFEIRFGISKPVSKTDYDNVVRELLRNKWSSKNIDGSQLLRISTEYYDTRIAQRNLDEDEGEENVFRGGARGPGPGKRRASEFQMSNIRLEIVGADMIEIYCKTNSLEALKNTPAANKKLKFTQKKPAPRAIGPFINGKNMPFIDFKDFNFRVSSQFEIVYPITSENESIRKIMNDWNPASKHFRSINRVRFTLPGSVVAVDISIVKSNRTYSKKLGDGKFKKIPIPYQTIQEAEVFSNAEIYEIELELDNDAITILMDSRKRKIEDLVQEVMTQIRAAVRTVLSGLQGTPYPISYLEQEDVIRDYMRCMHGDKWVAGKVDEESLNREKFPFPYFIGPSSITLQMEHIVPSNNTTSPNIALDYTVTEKADGQRALLYISKKGKIYMINNNLNVMFTGAMTEAKECFDSILDGEYIDYGKRTSSRTFLHLFAAFDIYFIGSRKDRSVRELAFCTNLRVEDENLYRLNLLEKFVSKLRIQSVVEKQACLFQIRCKTFYRGIMSGSGSGPSKNVVRSPKEEGEVEEEIEVMEEKTIFEGVEMIWSRREMFEYEIDGLIFTPMNMGVGGDVPGKASPMMKFKWNRSFKWKPPHYNTIDFLVSTKKDKFGKDLIRNKILTDEHNEITTIIQYKTLVLKCGFNPKKDKFVNAFNDMLFNRFEALDTQPVDDDETNVTYSTKGYQPVPFQPTSPYDPEACFCNIILQKDPVNSDQLYMRTMENDVFQEDTIVEFSYDKENRETESAWKWVPLRVRYDKTSELREKKNNFGNHFSVANDNWHSIHFPITENMIMGHDLPRENMLDDTVYYNRMDKDSMETQPLKDFHNLFVKLYIIQKVAKYLSVKAQAGNILLMDYAVGKAGDLFKWKTSGISFVFGVDISKDNIMNSKDGACVRYLTEKVKNPKLPPRAIFVHGNSSLNIRHNQKALYTNQEKDICKSIFGNGTGGVAKEYVGIARDGFHISSCQFAMHYFFEKKATLHSFLRNLAECTRLGGYFVGTCYNGQRVFDALKKKKMGESIRLDKNGKKIFEIVRDYSNQIETFPQNEKSIGLAINVFQESINKTFKEYLVNFTYFSRLMEDYGFVPLSKAEITSMNIVDTNASFELLFRNMEREIRENPKVYYGQALNMSKEEKTISFFNQFFLYKKVRNISLEQLAQIWKQQVGMEEEEEEEEEKEKGEKKNVVVKAKKIVGERIVLSLENYVPIQEESALKERVTETKEKVTELKEKLTETKERVTELKENITELKEKVTDLGEWEGVFQRLKPEVQEKLRKYPVAKRIEFLKKMQAPKTKIVVAK